MTAATLLVVAGGAALVLKVVETQLALRMLAGAWLAFVIRRSIQFYNLRNSIKVITCEYYLLTPWRSILWFVLPTMPYITRPFASPINDASVARKQYDDAGSTVTALATVFSPQVTLNVADAVAIKAINADRHIFPKPLELLQMLTPYGQNVLVTGGDEWKKHRKVVAPAFTENTYALGWKVSLSITNDWIADLDKRLGQTDHTKVKASVIEKDFPKLSLQLALSIFTTTAFGYRIASPGQVADPVPPGHTYNLKDTLEGALDLLNLFYAFFIPDWLRKIAFGRVQKALNLKQELNLWLAEIIQQRNFELNDGGERKDLLSNLVKANEDASKEDVSAVNGRNSSSQSLSLRELNGNAFIFLLAGHETTAHTLAFALALLAFYPDEQEKLYHQIIEVNADPDADIPYQDYGLYKRALAVVYETLRLYPSVIGIPKSVTATHDAIIPCSERGPGGIGTLFIPREALVNIDVQALHYDPVYWPDPESFKPDRFIDTDDYKYNRDAFLPFGGGARACLGRKFAEVEMTATLVAFCRKYCVILPDDMQGPPGESILNKKKRVLANKSMVTLTPLTYPWLLSAVKPLKIIDKQKCFDGKCSGVYHATIYTFCNHNMYGSFTHTSSDLSPGDPLTFYCLCKGMCSFRGKQPLAREMPWQWPMKRLCLVLHL